MKTIITFLLAITALFASAQSKYELILGVRTGTGYSATVHKSPITATDDEGNDLGTYRAIYKSAGIYVPSKAEVLFGLKGFRLGYMFNYSYNYHFRDRLIFLPENDFFPEINVEYKNRMHVFTHLARIEYNWAKQLKFYTLLFGPSIGIGGYHGALESVFGTSSMKDIYKFRAAVMLGVNLEIAKGPFSFVFSPTYTYHNLQPKRANRGRHSSHNFGLDIGFRVNLWKPKPKSN